MFQLEHVSGILCLRELLPRLCLSCSWVCGHSEVLGSLRHCSRTCCHKAILTPLSLNQHHRSPLGTTSLYLSRWRAPQG